MVNLRNQVFNVICTCCATIVAFLLIWSWNGFKNWLIGKPGMLSESMDPLEKAAEIQGIGTNLWLHNTFLYSVIIVWQLCKSLTVYIYLITMCIYFLSWSFYLTTLSKLHRIRLNTAQRKSLQFQGHYTQNSTAHNPGVYMITRANCQRNKIVKQ